nr:Rv3654c family TadE-like protein [Actinocorallia herbida]
MVWVMAVLGVVWSVGVVVMVGGGVRGMRKRAEMAADVAALAAAARTARGYADGCAVAGRVAEGTGAALTGCRVEGSAGLPVRVEVEVVIRGRTLPGWDLSVPAVSRAGTAPVPSEEVDDARERERRADPR